MSGVAFQNESISVSGKLHYVENPVSVRGDEPTANEVIVRIIELFKTENDEIYRQACRIQQMVSSPNKFQALRNLIDNSSPWIVVVPNEVNRQPGYVMITKRFTISFNHQENISFISETAIAQLKKTNRAQVTILTVSENASRSIKKLANEDITTERTYLIYQSRVPELPQNNESSIGRWLRTHQCCVAAGACVFWSGAIILAFYFGLVLPSESNY